MTDLRQGAHDEDSRIMPIHIEAVVVAAGKGTRLAGPIAKSMMILGDKPLFAHSLAAFERATRIKGIILVVPSIEIATARYWIEKLQFIKVKAVVPGGMERGDSVQEGLSAVSSDTQWVAIHDGARPFVSSVLIDRVLDKAMEVGGAVPIVPLTDTIKEIRDGEILRTIDRATLGGAQTPQIFAKARLFEAYRLAAEKDTIATDDADIVQRFTPGPIAAVQGEDGNFKITTPEDWRRAEAAWQQPQRAGSGFPSSHQIRE
jgi:2-C-methyl-D-erythritol 4-phosphate cytidylyltransferase